MTKKKSLDGKRILIVDDEPDVASTLEELLSMCHSVKAFSFEEGRERLEADSFDIAILDIMGVNGYKLLEIAVQKNVTAVMLTAHALTVEDTVKSFEGGAAYFIPKDEMANIAVYLNDILEAKRKGESLWTKWLGRFYDEKF